MIYVSDCVVGSVRGYVGIEESICKKRKLDGEAMSVRYVLQCVALTCGLVSACRISARFLVYSFMRDIPSELI